MKSPFNIQSVLPHMLLHMELYFIHVTVQDLAWQNMPLSQMGQKEKSNKKQKSVSSWHSPWIPFLKSYEISQWASYLLSNIININEWIALKCIKIIVMKNAKEKIIFLYLLDQYSLNHTMCQTLWAGICLSTRSGHFMELMA